MTFKTAGILLVARAHQLDPDAPPLEERVAGIPPKLARLVHSCLDPEPVRRPASAALVAGRLSALAESARPGGTKPAAALKGVPEYLGLQTERVGHASSPPVARVLREATQGVVSQNERNPGKQAAHRLRSSAAAAIGDVAAVVALAIGAARHGSLGPDSMAQTSPSAVRAGPGIAAAARARHAPGVLPPSRAAVRQAIVIEGDVKDWRSHGPILADRRYFYNVFLEDRAAIGRLQQRRRLRVTGMPAGWNAELGLLKLESARVVD